MELKEFIRIIKKHTWLFFSVVILAILAAGVYFFLRPASYSTSLTLNITRSGVQNTEGYKYDDFYRIQADDKFAETVVQWLKSPRVISDIYKEAGLDAQRFSLGQLAKAVKPEKLSSQVISVTYSSPDAKTAQNLSQAISKIISQNTQNLNKDQKEEAWFEVIAHDPVVIKDIFSPVLIFIISILAGIFIAFWVVLIKHYLE